MKKDEQAIRDLITTWMSATAAGDLPRVLSLMDENAVFLVHGQPPMRGRNAFSAGFLAATECFRIEAASAIQEIQVEGDWAYLWNYLTVTMIPRQAGARKHRAGNVLTILRKQDDGSWLLFRDANLLAEEHE